MENIIFYAPLVFCILLLGYIAVQFKIKNKLKKNAEFWEECYTETNKKNSEERKQNLENLTIVSERNTKYESEIELLKASIENRNEAIELLSESVVNKDGYIKELEQSVVNKAKKNEEYLIEIKKQHDLILLGKETFDSLTNRIKEQNESLTNHLQERAKEEKPFNVLDSLEDLIPRKMETKKTKRK